MTITLPMPEKNGQPPPPNPLNVLNLLLSKLKAMETSDSTGEITEVDVELCNKIYYILNPAAAPEEAPSTEEFIPVEGEAPPVEGSETTLTEEVPPAEGGEAALNTDVVTPVTDTLTDAPSAEDQPVEAPPTDVTLVETAPMESTPVEAAA